MAASFVIDLTRVPLDITTNAALMADTRYTVQNISAPAATIYFIEGGATPLPTAPAARLEVGGNGVLSADASLPFWMWTDESGGAKLIFFEAP